jgi:hypothetical protein
VKVTIVPRLTSEPDELTLVVVVMACTACTTLVAELLALLPSPE